MDAPEEELDIKLQKVSGDLIADFDRSLRPFLRRRDGTVRGSVRSRETTRLTSSLLDPFQELPQLLDPHLAGWAQTLADAFLDYLRSPRRRSRASSLKKGDAFMPLPTAICKLLYTLCKVRGEKVIVRFLSVETKWLELLLSALESSERGSLTEAPPPTSAADDTNAVLDDNDEAVWWIRWTWEERYVVLLWLSHLFLAPFDLATISSGSSSPEEEDESGLPEIPGFRWPPGAPGITVRVLPLALKYLASPGRERDAARALLVRVAMRRDMQQLGLLHALVQWSLFSVRPKTEAEMLADSPYYYIGVLSFLAGTLAASADTSDMDRYLMTVFYAVLNVSSNTDPASRAIAASALARKTMIKVVRSIAVLVLRRPLELDDGGGRSKETAMVEAAIGYLLDCLADNDTPVRFAASKALSIITLRLEPDFASQVVEAVLESLDRNVRWLKPASATPGAAAAAAASMRDLASVDPLEWHGLMLTLSHLVYRRSPPAGDLAGIVQALLTGLSFERRGASGGSIGTNVRDAACFGIWAMARRYTTAELLAVPTEALTSMANSTGAGTLSSPDHNPAKSVLQILATELIVTASLDPSGNIRRGSSAALQELVGRHPDTVEEGIWVVQAVDYHAVALRARAVSQVSLGATKLSDQYGEAILDAILGWRGVGDVDAAARRVAATTFGAVAQELALSSDPGGRGAFARFSRSVDMLLARLEALQARQAEDRHGLLMALAAVLDSFPSLVSARSADGTAPLEDVTTVVRQTLLAIERALGQCRGTLTRRPELVAEAGSQLIVASFPILQAATFVGAGSPPSPLSSQLWPKSSLQLLPGAKIIASKSNERCDLSTLVRELDGRRIEAARKLPIESATTTAAATTGEDDPSHRVLKIFQDAVGDWLGRAEQEVIDAVSAAALVLLVFSDTDDRGGIKGRRSLLNEWAEFVRRPVPRAGGGGGKEAGYFFALTMAHPIVPHLSSGDAAAAAAMAADITEEASKLDLTASSTLICAPILERWAADARIGTRVSILQSLTDSDLLRDGTAELLPLVAEGLDDYTANARGDVGSHVRLQALKATRTLWEALGQASPGDEGVERMISTLFLRVLRLAVEKLDRVRSEAQMTLALTLNARTASTFRTSTFSSRNYFTFLLNLLTRVGDDIDQMHPSAAAAARADPDRWMEELLAGLVTSADTGHEDLVINSRAALSSYCARSQDNVDRVCGALMRNLKRWTAPASKGGEQQKPQQGDRVVVPTLSIIAYLFHADVFPRCRVADYRSLCLAVQRAGYKSGNVRKLEACIRVYGGVAGMLLCGPVVAVVSSSDDNNQGEGGAPPAPPTRDPADFPLATPELEARRTEGIREARKRLGALLLHPWPRVRTAVVDELWVLLCSEGPASGAEKLKGVDWGTADKSAVKALVDELGLNK